MDSLPLWEHSICAAEWFWFSLAIRSLTVGLLKGNIPFYFGACESIFYPFSKVPPNKMLGHLTLHWASFQNVVKKMTKLNITSVEIGLIASTQGHCIIKVLVIFWCSNNSPSMTCTHVNFWYYDAIWGRSLQYSAISAASIFLVCVVFCRNCYACFIFLSFVFVECFWDFVCEWLRVCLYSTCALFLVAHPSDPQYHDYSDHWTISVLLNVQRQNTDVYFSCYENCHL